MELVVESVAVVMVALVTAAGTWLVARRTTSGRIDTTEAATLWDEGTQMRLELRNEVLSLKLQLTEAIAAITSLNHEIKASRAETEYARSETRRSREETRMSRAETRELMMQIEELHGEVKTGNALTMGQLADNTETRRILELSKEDRSVLEAEHLATAGARMSRSERPAVTADELADNDPGGKP